MVQLNDPWHVWCRINNAASGGFAGFTFPNAPRAIKDFRTAKRPDGRPFVPSERPMIAFRGNTVHSTGDSSAPQHLHTTSGLLLSQSV